MGASDTRLLLEADASRYLLDLAPESMRKIAETEDERRASIHLKPPFSKYERFARLEGDRWVPMSDAEILTHVNKTLDPYEFLHARYNVDWENYALKEHGVRLYRTFGAGSILRTADRMKLVKMIMERSVSMNPRNGTRGCGLNLAKMVYDKKLLGGGGARAGPAYSHGPQAPFLSTPLSPPRTSRRSASTSCTTPCRMYAPLSTHASTQAHPSYAIGDTQSILPWRQPLEDIRNYFGEKIAMYFGFMAHYTLWLLVPSIVGVVVFILQIVNI